mmetsp:Transcript_1547/g.3389  ORF Transcript_1547/g.3389 Transcript_1547/m.3389 type:complete len:114 (+) Transcript_1547:169-510(+)
MFSFPFAASPSSIYLLLFFSLCQVLPSLSLLFNVGNLPPPSFLLKVWQLSLLISVQGPALPPSHLTFKAWVCLSFLLKSGCPSLSSSYVCSSLALLLISVEVWLSRLFLLISV